MAIDPTLASANAEQQQQQQSNDFGAVADIASVGLDIVGAAARGMTGASAGAAPEAAAGVLEAGHVAAEAGTGILGAIGGFFEGLASL